MTPEGGRQITWPTGLGPARPGSAPGDPIHRTYDRFRGILSVSPPAEASAAKTLLNSCPFAAAILAEWSQVKTHRNRGESEQ